MSKRPWMVRITFGSLLTWTYADNMRLESTLLSDSQMSDKLALNYADEEWWAKQMRNIYVYQSTRRERIIIILSLCTSLSLILSLLIYFIFSDLIENENETQTKIFISFLFSFISHSIVLLLFIIYSSWLHLLNS